MGFPVLSGLGGHGLTQWASLGIVVPSQAEKTGRMWVLNGDLSPSNVTLLKRRRHPNGVDREEFEVNSPAGQYTGETEKAKSKKRSESESQKSQKQ